MTSNIILECSQKDAASSPSNSNWVSTFQNDQMIETGDTLRMKQCLINTQAINSQNIVLDKDVGVIIEFCLYENVLPVHTIPFEKDKITDTDGFTNEQTYRQAIVGKLSVPKTVETTQTAVGTTVVLEDITGLSNGMAILGVNIASDATIHSINTTAKSITMSKESEGELQADDSLIFTAVSTKAQNEAMSGYYMLREEDDTVITNPIITHSVQINLAAGTYSPEVLAATITSGMKRHRGSHQLGTAFVPDFTNPVSAFVAVDGSASVKSFTMTKIELDNNSKGTRGFATRLNGSTNSLFEYKDTAFQFSFLHTPLMTEKTTGPGGGFTVYQTPGVSIGQSLLKVDGTNAEAIALFPPKIYESFGGVLLTSLQPTTFWNKLGFNDLQLEEILYVDATMNSLGDATLKDSYIHSRTTGVNIASAFCRSDLLSGPFNTIIPREEANGTADGTYPIAVPVATSDVRPIIAKLPYTVDNIGFYRIEAITALSNEYNTPNERKSKVTAVVSKNYNTNDFITGYGGDSSLDYEHIGESTVLNNIQIRIVDPLSEKEVENLGPHSTVFMELVKAPPQQKSNVKHK